MLVFRRKVGESIILDGVICVSVLAVEGEGLWERFDKGHNLLFTANDFQHPDTSGLFQELWRSGEGDPTRTRLIGETRSPAIQSGTEWNRLVVRAVEADILLLVNDRRIMGSYANGPVANLVAVLTVVGLILLTALFLLSTLPGTPFSR